MNKFKELQLEQTRAVGDGVRPATLMNLTGATGGGGNGGSSSSFRTINIGMSEREAAGASMVAGGILITYLGGAFAGPGVAALGITTGLVGVGVMAGPSSHAGLLGQAAQNGEFWGGR